MATFWNNLKVKGGEKPTDTYTKQEVDNLLNNKLDKTDFNNNYFDTDDRGFTRNKRGLNINNQYLFNVRNPESNNDAANKKYVDSKVPLINIVGETAIPNYQINSKQVYRKYCTTDNEIKEIFNISDYMTMYGIALSNSNGKFKNCPWFYDKNQAYMIDANCDGGLYNAGFSTTGHKIVVEYTKK